MSRYIGDECLAFEGRRIASGSYLTITLWDAATGQQTLTHTAQWARLERGIQSRRQADCQRAAKSQAGLARGGNRRSRSHQLHLQEAISRRADGLGQKELPLTISR